MARERTYSFESHRDFVDRDLELHHLHRWWNDASDRFPLIVYGRRRTGKSWLVREFAHGKPAHIFVCDRRAEGDQLASFADHLQPALGLRPELADVRSFFQLLFQQARRGKRLAIIDEFPELMSQGRPADSVLAGVMEEELGSSRLKLLLCGSHVSTMEGLLAARNPLHGRGHRFQVTPLTFRQAQLFLKGHTGPDLIERYAVAGGMPLYLQRLARKAPLKTVIAEDMLSRFGLLFDEPREILEMELSNTAIYFSLLAALASHRNLSWDDLVAESKVEDSTASRYIRTLEDLHLVEAYNPLFAQPRERKRRYRMRDPLMRFWFRFVFPIQEELAAGASAADHFRRNIEPYFADHVAPAFEDICRAWVRECFGARVDAVGAWWGLARNDLRRAKLRSSEEIDIVAAAGRKVLVAGEVKWSRQAMDKRVLEDLRQFKLPALKQVGVDVDSAQIVLFSRGGFHKDLRTAAEGSSLRLIGLDELLEEAA